MRLAKLDANLGINLGACVEAILDPSLGPSLGTRPRTFRCSVGTREPNLTRPDPTCPLGLWTAKTWPRTGPELARNGPEKPRKTVGRLKFKLERT